jgi:hypothetical protein
VRITREDETASSAATSINSTLHGTGWRARSNGCGVRARSFWHESSYILGIADLAPSLYIKRFVYTVEPQHMWWISFANGD